MPLSDGPADSWHGDETVRLSTDDRIATVTIDRPDRLNVLSREALDGLQSAVRAAIDEDAHVLVLTGAGDRAFAAGADIDVIRDLSTPEALGYAERGHEVCRSLEQFPGPAVAAIDGHALGGGCELALACDLRVATTTATLGLPEVDLGVMPGWGGTQRLPRIVGDETARRMIYFGERIDAEAAQDRGLVGRVVEPDAFADHVRGTARDLADRPRHALLAAKDAINTSRETHLEAGLRFERRAWAGLFGTDDQRERMAAFVEGGDQPAD